MESQQEQSLKCGANQSEVQNPQPKMEVPNPHPPPSQYNCPRCDSSNTKFCYYNNYSLTQPRHFCKSCKRYWTQGGTLRNVPIGGGCRKPKRAKNSPNAIGSDIVVSQPEPPVPNPNPITTGMDLVRAAMPTTMVDPIYSGGPLVSTFPQMRPVNGPGAVGGSQFGTNHSPNQGLHIPYWKPEIGQSKPQGEVFPLQTMSSWTHRFFNGDASTSSSTGNSNFWGATTFNGCDQVGTSTSFNQNQWSSDNKNTGF